MNTNTSTEANGRKELKVAYTNDADKLLDKFFEEYVKYPNLSRNDKAKEDIEYVLSTHAINFTTAKEQSVKTLGGDDNENGQEFISNIDVLASGRNDFIPEEIAKGAGMNVKLAPKDKVKAKVDQIRKKDAEKKREESSKDKDMEK